MKTGMIIKTDGGNFAFSVEDSYLLIGLANRKLLDEWRKLKDEGKELSAKKQEMLDELRQIRNSIEPE